MALSDLYVASSGSQSISVTTADQPILLLTTPSTKRFNISGIRFSIGATSAAANQAVTVKLARTANSPTGGTAVTARPHDSAAPTSLAANVSTPAYTIAPTLGAILGWWTVPQTSGSMWEEFPPGGQEWMVPVSASVCVFVTLSVGTATPIFTDLVWSE
jgi:hypothetical protein